MWSWAKTHAPLPKEGSCKACAHAHESHLLGGAAPHALRGIFTTMMGRVMVWLDFLKDDYLFWVLEAAYVLFAFYCIFKDYREKKAEGTRLRGSRGNESMQKMHGTYLALAFLVVLITLNARPVQDFKVLFLVINVPTLAYLCYFNAWFRNWLLDLINKSANIES